MLILKFMTLQSSQKTIAIYILTNISRSKGNQTMKFDQLIKYNMRKIFIEKSYTKCAEEIIPRPLSKRPKLSISRDQQQQCIIEPSRTLSYNPKLSPNSHSHKTISNPFFNQKEHYGNEDLSLTNLVHFYAILNTFMQLSYFYTSTSIFQNIYQTFHHK